LVSQKILRPSWCPKLITGLSSSAIQIAFAWYFVENIFSKRFTFRSARECRRLSSRHMQMDDLWSKDGQRVYDKKVCCVPCHGGKYVVFCDTAFCLDK